MRIVFWLLLLSLSASAQEIKPLSGFGVEANVFSGRVIKHTEKFKLPVPESSHGLDINLHWKTYGKKEWHQRRRYPTVGIGFTYTNYGIDSIYGRCFSIYPNIEIPLITSKNLQWTFRIGDGAGFVTRRYSRTGKYLDTTNNAIGSNINDYASFMTDIRYRVSDHLYIQAGANFSHISNAAYHQPNLGINLYGGHVGVKYFPVTSSTRHIVHDLKPLKSRWLAQFRLTIANNQSNAPLGPLYPIYLGTAYASKRWISKNKFMTGIDWSYHTGIYSFLRNNSGSGFADPGTERQHSYKSAVFIGNEFLLGRLGVVLQAGFYIHQAYQSQGKLYQKLGGNYYLIQKEHGPIKELFVCGYLKTHLSVAELAEFGFGMGF